MPLQGAPSRNHSEPPPLTLASRPFPRRVRRVLEGILEYTSDELERALAATLNEVEQQLFKLAEQARSNDIQQACFEALRAVKRSRADFTPRFMIGLEAALAGLGDPAPGTSTDNTPRAGAELSLVEDVEMEENTLLSGIASRAEVRSSLPLYLLGQRFGVLAGAPAFEPDQLPVGPQSLCRILRRATDGLDIHGETRLLVFRQFERQMMATYGAFVEAINSFLATEGVLPTLTYVPMRARRRQAEGSGPEAGAPAPAAGRAQGARTRPAMPGDTGWPGEAGSRGGEASQRHGEEMFAVMRQLLAGRRELAGRFSGNEVASRAATYVASQSDIESVLGVLQRKAPALHAVDGKTVPRSFQHIKQELLAQLRQVAPEGRSPVLEGEDADTLDLIGMLFDYIMRDLQPGSPAATLIGRLYVPLTRVALRDKGFFTRKQHPARQMLSAIAESGMFWSREDEADPGSTDKMESLVERVVSDFDGDTAIFDTLSEDLSGHLQTMARKAEVAERRHVEAARGREKLEIARLQASEAIEAKLADRKIPRFVHTLLSQAWTDVLALSLLRQGEQSPVYQRQLVIAETLIAAAAGDGDGLQGEEAPGLREEIQQALAQVGYHGEDARAIATRLTDSQDEERDRSPGASGDDPASRTELALRLKARARLGGDVASRPGKPQAAALSDAERGFHEQLRRLPFGTWLEFTTNQQGDRVRRRMSWYSTMTGHALFVNQRGQRVGEYSLEWLAKAMASGQVRLVESERGTLIDRAWGAIVSALKSFGGGTDTAAGGAR